MATEYRKRTQDLPAGNAVSGTDLVPVYQSALGLVKVAASALATYLVPLVAAAQPWQATAIAATVNLASISSPNVLFNSGSGAISSFGTGSEGTRKWCRNTVALTLTHGTNLQCPNNVDLVLPAGSKFRAVLRPGGVIWDVEAVLRADGAPATYVGAPAGMRNRVVNGGMSIDQDFGGASTTITAGAALKWVADVHYAWCTGANVTAQVVTNAAGQTRLRYTGAASNTLVGFGHRIERANAADLAGKTATLSVALASSSLTSIAWEVYRANTNDTFGSIASPTRTLIASGSFTPVSATEAKFSATMSIPAAATTGLEIVLKSSAGLLAGATLDIGELQLEAGNAVTDFERRPGAVELNNVQRYFQKMNTYVPQGTGVPLYYVPKRVAPSVASPASGFGTSGTTPSVDMCYVIQTTGSFTTVTVDARLAA